MSIDSLTSNATTVDNKKQKRKSKKSRQSLTTDVAQDESTRVDNTEICSKKRKHDSDNTSSEKKEHKKKRKAEKENGVKDLQSEITQLIEKLDEPVEVKEKKKKSKPRKVSSGDHGADTVETPVDAVSIKRKERGTDDDSKERKERKRKRKEEKRRKVEALENTNPAIENTPTPPSKSQVSPTPSSSSVTASPAEIDAYLKKHSITIQDLSSSPPQAILDFTTLYSRIPTVIHETFKTFKEPTPIQACSWPPALDGRDVVGIAETGSGKTLAFGVPGITRLAAARSSDDASNSKKSKSKARISLLVLAPTRELAIQTHETLSALGDAFGLSSVALYGGVDKEPQRKALAAKNAAMVVGTPGRIIDLLNEGACDLSGVNYLVLDEADRMLDKGFENDIRSIIQKTSSAEQRQTLMFSATWPDAVRKLAASFQKNPVRVTVGSDDLTANSRVEQFVEVFDDTREKDGRLFGHLNALKARRSGRSASVDEARILVFVLYKKEAARVENTLQRRGYSVGGIHGDLNQSARIAALEDFKTGRVQILVATDVAARGLDIPNVGTVINYSFPLTIEDYIHRIGRTGRGGRSGKSITFFTGENHERALAGEFARVLRESGFDAEPLKKFPMTIKKKTHSVYGAFYREDIPVDAKPTRIVF